MTMKKIKSFIKKYLLWLIALIGIILFWSFVRMLAANNLESFDNFIYNLIKPLINPQMTVIFRFITELGNFPFIILVLLSIYIFSKDKNLKIYASLNALAVFIINFLLKSIFVRPRPIGINLIFEKGFSFPSGHSMESLAFYGFLAYYIYHSNLKKQPIIILITLLTLIILLIGLSRIYLGVHYASDVIAGFSISLTYLVLFIKLIYPTKKN